MNTLATSPCSRPLRVHSGARKHARTWLSDLRIPGLSQAASLRIRKRGVQAAQAATVEPISAAAERPPIPLEEQTEFEKLGVDGRLTVKLGSLGIDAPSDIQTAAIPEISQGTSLAIQSFTGSGKTLAFLLPVMTMAVKRLEQRVVTREARDDYGPEAVIVAPSRELAMQIVHVAQSLLPQEAWPLVQQAIGGANMKRQLEAMKRNRPLLIVGTPGRLAEHSRIGSLRTHRTAAVVLDEVDQLLCSQFQADMLRIVQHLGSKLPDGPQLVAASATMSPAMVSNIQRMLNTDKPIPIVSLAPPPAPATSASTDAGTSIAERAASGDVASVSMEAAPQWGWGSASGFWANRTGAAANRGSAGGVGGGHTAASSMPPGLQHCYVTEAKRDHIDLVRRLLYALESQRAIVFMNHQQRLRDAMYKLGTRGLSVGVLHGEMGKQQRAAILEGFRSGKYQVVLVSDVLARGLDVVECDAVVNLEMPSNAAHYAHRAGRTGRMGRPGVVVSIVDKQSVFVVNKLASALGIDIPTCKVAGGRATVIQNGAVKILGRFEEQTARAALLAEQAAADEAAADQSTSADESSEGTSFDAPSEVDDPGLEAHSDTDMSTTSLSGAADSHVPHSEAAAGFVVADRAGVTGATELLEPSQDEAGGALEAKVTGDASAQRSSTVRKARPAAKRRAPRSRRAASAREPDALLVGTDVRQAQAAGR